MVQFPLFSLILLFLPRSDGPGRNAYQNWHCLSLERHLKFTKLRLFQTHAKIIYQKKSQGYHENDKPDLWYMFTIHTLHGKSRLSCVVQSLETLAVYSLFKFSANNKGTSSCSRYSGSKLGELNGVDTLVGEELSDSRTCT